jgi:hypothetical protein
MLNRSAKWTVDELSQAMANAIFASANSRLLKQQGDIVKFNGFWRKGDKQNVCAWLNKAAWHDAKTGEGGGCKEFAKVAFNINLPEFMERFGPHKLLASSDFKKAINDKPGPSPVTLIKSVEQIFQSLCRPDKIRNDRASEWLEERGLVDPRSYIGSGFANLNESDISIFDDQHQNFIRQRLSIAHQIIVPLRSPDSAQAKNLFFRSISSCPKEDKSRLLPNAAGWHEPDGAPRAFGFPHLINDFPNLILCEGMADYFTTELLLDCEHNFLPIGVGSASALPKWAIFLAEQGFDGNVIIIFHLDQDKNGNLSDIGIGQENSIKCINHLQGAGINAKLFPWLRFLKRLNNFTEVRDLADSLKLGLKLDDLQKNFLNLIQEIIDV